MGFEAEITVTMGEKSPRVVAEVSGHDDFSGLWVFFDGTEPDYLSALEAAPYRSGEFPPGFSERECKMLKAMIENAVRKFESQLVKIIWNGCDEYVLLEDALKDPDLREKIEGETLYTTTGEHKAIRVAEVNPESDELDEAGLPLDGGTFLIIKPHPLNPHFAKGTYFREVQ